MMHKCLIGFLVVSSLSIPAVAAIVYDESVNGQLSSDRLSPTVITVAPGSNQIYGDNGNLAPSVRDYLTFTVPVDFMLTSITMLDAPVGARGFIGLQAGNQLTLPPSTTTAAGLLGWWHYTAAGIGADIFPVMGVPANGSTGFAAPLGAGSYTLWIQDSSPGTFGYGFDLEIQQVPEPGTWTTCVGALLAASLLRRKRTRP